ncbi:MAG: DsbE family thiol:disulfide interchange protein [Alphaproteobacteria bacterium]|nr:DsbE family thiol:disulfide interchange protein [Alphaproteobacteria bacterium]
MRRLVFLLPIALFALVAGYLFLGLQRDPALLPSALLDKPAPDFRLVGLAGQPGLARSDLAGGVALVNFFASWCAPCRVEHPLLMRLAAEQKIALFGIDYKDKPDDAARLLEELGNPYRRIGVDRDGRTAIDFGVYGVPETYLIDAAGRIRYRQVGPITAADWEMKLLPLLHRLGLP